MPSPVDDIVDLQIVVTDKAPSFPSFGTPLLLGYHTAWLSDLVREYESQDDMLTDGFTVNDALYKVATVVKSQIPSPTTFKIGRRTVALTQVLDAVPTITTQGFIYSGTINGADFSYTVLAGASVATICTALTALLNPLAGYAVADGTTKITFTTGTAGTVLDYKFGKGFTVTDVTVDTTTDDELAAIVAEDEDWYGLIVADSSSKATALLAAAFIEAHPKICVLQSADDAILDGASTTDTAYALKALGYNRTAGIYHRPIGGSEWLAAGWEAGRLATDPGSDTWAFKEVPGASVDVISAGGKSALKAKNWSRYIEQGGLNITFDGKAASGRYMDVTRGVDWLQATMQLDVYSVLVNNPKVPFTASGLSSIGLAMEGALKKGQIAGLLADDTPYTVTVPKLSDISSSDRAARIAKGFKFTARLAGALHGVQIRGTLSV
jgi:hypothetical protein